MRDRRLISGNARQQQDSQQWLTADHGPVCTVEGGRGWSQGGWGVGARGAQGGERVGSKLARAFALTWVKGECSPACFLERAHGRARLSRLYVRFRQRLRLRS